MRLFLFLLSIVSLSASPVSLLLQDGSTVAGDTAAIDSRGAWVTTASGAKVLIPRSNISCYRFPAQAPRVSAVIIPTPAPKLSQQQQQVLLGNKNPNVIVSPWAPIDPGNLPKLLALASSRLQAKKANSPESTATIQSQ